MHAVVVKVSVQPGHDKEGRENLEKNVLPMVKQAPGAISGYWLAPSEGNGMSVVLFETEDAAQGAAKMIPSAPRPDFVTLDNVEVREVIAKF
jgi:uncharacterized protein DUF6338